MLKTKKYWHYKGPLVVTTEVQAADGAAEVVCVVVGGPHHQVIPLMDPLLASLTAEQLSQSLAAVKLNWMSTRG